MKNPDGTSNKGGLYRYNPEAIYEIDDIIYHEGLCYIVEYPNVQGVEPPDETKYRVLHKPSNDNSVIGSLSEYVQHRMNPFGKNKIVEASLIKDILRYHLGDFITENEIFYNELVDLNNYFKNGVFITSHYSTLPVTLSSIGTSPEPNTIVRVSRLIDKDMAMDEGDNVNKVLQEVWYDSGVYKWRVTLPSEVGNSNPFNGPVQWSRWYFSARSNSDYIEFSKLANEVLNLNAITVAERSRFLRDSNTRVQKYDPNSQYEPELIEGKFCHLIIDDPNGQSTVSKFITSINEVPSNCSLIIYYD